MANEKKHAELVARKMAAGLSKEDAHEVATRQVEHDEALAEAEKAKAVPPAPKK